MGYYRNQILPRILNKVMDNQGMREVRTRVCSGLAGQVVEIGFGTGLNAPHYPRDVTRVLAVEPSTVGVRIARSRIDRSEAPVELAGLTGERLDLPSEAFDAVLSTWTMCSIPDLEAALTEAHRVLVPGGALHFVEHGRAPDPKVQRWQHRLEPLNKRLGGGCHLTRRIPEYIEQAGFAIERLDTYYLKGEPKVTGSTFEGRAIKH
jgi:ubiquinone/menaquinone biosynthesis C-methylase UbiE